MYLARLSIRRPVTAVMAMLVVIMLGVVSYSKLHVDLLPNINPPVIAVVTRFPGASPQEVCDLVTVPVEAALATVSGIQQMSSISQEETSLVILMFDWGKNMSSARADVSERIDLLKLPDEAGKPMVLEFDPTLLPVMQITLSASGNLDIAAVTELAEGKVKPRLEGLEGVAAVDVLGGVTRRITVTMDQAKMLTYGLSIEQIAGIIQASNLNYPMGQVQKDDLVLDLRLQGKLRSAQELSDLVVGYYPVDRGVVPIRLRDIARVEEGYTEPTSITRVGGRPGVTLSIRREGSANIVSLSRSVKRELDALSSELGGLDVIVTMDQARFIERTIDTVRDNLLLGAALAVLVLFAFLRDFRTTSVISISIPFSVIATFVLVYFSKMTLNIMTLGGLALGVGMLVDNSIVVIENIFRHVESGEKPDVAAELGTGEVALAITASTLTTIVVFLPVVFVGGITGILFKELAWTVTFSLLASLIVALTIVPMLSSRWLARRGTGRTKARLGQGFVSESTVGRDTAYVRLLRWSLDHKFAVLFSVAVLAALAFYFGRLIPTEFLPPADEGQFTININMKPGTRLETIDRLVGSIEDILKQERLIDQYSVTIGHSEGSLGFGAAMGSSDASILVYLTDDAAAKKATRSVIEAIQKKVDMVKGDAVVTYNTQSSLMMMAGDMPSVLQVVVSGPEIDVVSKLADEAIEKISGVQGLSDVQSSLKTGKPEIHIIVDKEKALQNGLTPAQVALSVSKAVKGQTVTRIESSGTTTDVIVRYDKDAVASPEAIGDLILPARAGKIRLRDIATIQENSGPLVIRRTDRRLSAQITAQISNVSLGTVTSEVSKALKGVQVPTGYSIQIRGISEIMREGFSALNTAFLLAAILVYMVMAASFESLGQPFIIMFTLPLAAIGVVASLYFSGYAFGITAFIGAIILAGVVVNNGIVMVDFINQRRSAGMHVREAVVDGASKRLRPVLMTSLTTILGLLPMAMGLGQGGELEAPLALTLMGGLTSGTFLTLIVIPIMYELFAGRGRKKPVSKRLSDAATVRAEKSETDSGVTGVIDGMVGHPAPRSGPAAKNVLYAESRAGIPSGTGADHVRAGEIGAREELVLGPAFDSEELAELIKLLEKLYGSIKRYYDTGERTT